LNDTADAVCRLKKDGGDAALLQPERRRQAGDPAAYDCHRFQMVLE
jgi:hypothetical protein